MVEINSPTVRSFWLRVKAKIELDVFLTTGMRSGGDLQHRENPSEIAGIPFTVSGHHPAFTVTTDQWVLLAERQYKRELTALLNGTQAIDAEGDPESYYIFELIKGTQSDFDRDCTLMMMFYE